MVRPATYQELCDMVDDFDETVDLQDWEEDFVIDMQEKRAKGESFTPREITKIEELWDKHCG